MGYQALYRRYRPANFGDFVGQEAVIRTLRSQVMSGRIAHAYLFCGTRGTGKTSAAKVFARAVNCEHPVNGDPCGACRTCQALEAQSSLDILEIDAASNNGVDEIRDLREKVKYPPQTGRSRVYIIDEVHMLSTGAFNALLKTLEEPPSYVVFILATTEPQKLPATILSRCQRFDFARISAGQIVERLNVAIKEGGLRAEDGALRRIARAAEGGMRDAWSIMDMCLGYAQEDDNGLTEELVLRVLGAADKRFLFAFADSLIRADAPTVLRQIDEMMRMGREVQVFVRDVSAHLRALMLAQICTPEQTEEILEVTAEDAQEYTKQAQKASYTRLMRMLDLFLASETDMKWAAQPRFALETAALRACRPEESLELEALIARVDELERRPAASADVRALQQRVEELEEKLRQGVVSASAEKPKAKAPVREKEAEEPAKEARKAPGGADPQAEKIWQEALRSVRKDPKLYGCARFGRVASAEDGRFTIVFDRVQGGMYVKILNMEEKTRQLSEALTAAAGYACTFCAAIEGSVPEKNSQVLEAMEAEREQAQANINKVFDLFGRENVRVTDMD